MPTEKELSSYYKRVYAMILRIKRGDLTPDQAAEDIRIEMDAEDAAYVEKILGEKQGK